MLAFRVLASDPGVVFSGEDSLLRFGRGSHSGPCLGVMPFVLAEIPVDWCGFGELTYIMHMYIYI